MSLRFSRTLAALGLVGACTVVDKADYTFDDSPGGGDDDDPTGGKGGSAGSSGGTGGNNGGTSGEAGEGNGGTSGTSGTSGEGGDGTGGGGGGACDPNPCENGHCTASGSSFTCDCDDGWQGVTCDDEIDECNPNPCSQGAPCMDLVADFECMCPTQWTGKTCELPRFQGLAMGPVSRARSVSADGTMVLGTFQNPPPNAVDRPYHWAEGDPMPRPLPLAMTMLPPDARVVPWALSGNGAHWVGEFSSATGGPFPTGGSTSGPGMFGMPPNAFSASVVAVNEDGTHSVGYFTEGGANIVRALRWDSSGMPMPLPDPLGGMSTYTVAGAITRDGQIIVGSLRDSSGGWFIVGWAEPGTTPPPMRRQPGPTLAIAVHGVSADGMTAIGSFVDAPTMQTFAFVTQGSTFVNIGPILGASTGPAPSNAWDMSDDGSVIVGDLGMGMGMPGMPSEAFIWQRIDENMPYVARRLFDVLRDSRAEPMGWTLTNAYGVSADGKVVVGEARDPQGQTTGYIARLP